MTHRFLHPDEWPRLAETDELRDAWRYLRPDRDRVLVVEDAAGAIVATWAFYYRLHADGFWIHPAHQGKAAALRHLLKGIDAMAGLEPIVWTGAIAPLIDDLIARYRHTAIPIRHYALALPLTRGES